MLTGYRAKRSLLEPHKIYLDLGNPFFRKERVAIPEIEICKVADTIPETKKCKVQLFGTLENVSLVTIKPHLLH